MLDIETDAIAESQHQYHRHRNHDQNASQVTPNLQHFLPRNCLDPVVFHSAASFGDSCFGAAVSETNTSSNDAGIFSMRVTATDFVCSTSRNFGIAASAFSTTACSALPNTATSIATVDSWSASSASPSGSHSISSSSPFIAVRFSSAGEPDATIFPR